VNYTRITRRFGTGGLNLNAAPDAIPENQYGILTNARFNQQGLVQARPPIELSQTVLSGKAIHSIKTFQDSYGTNDYTGIGAAIYRGNASVDTGYSGNPVTWALYQPQQSVTAYLYVGDSTRLRKIRNDGTIYNVGIVPPGVAPATALGVPLFSPISDFDVTTGWSAGGTAGSLSIIARVPNSTTIAEILYDSGSTGWACVVFSGTATAWLAAGARLVIDSSTLQETSEVQSVIAQANASTTTVTAIAYDSGTSGPCCIVLASISAGELIQDGLIKVNTELVRILSVTQSDDNSTSIRASTANTHAAGETVTFYNTARMYFTKTHAATAAVAGGSLASAVTVGVGTISQTQAIDLSQIGGRPLQAADYMHISCLVDNLNNITSIRVLLDVDSSSNDFAHNYYYAEFSQNLFQTAIANTATNSASQLAAIEQAAVTAAAGAFTQPPSAVSGINPTTLQLYTGTSQWSEVLMNLSDLVRVGADQSRTLANVQAVQIEITCTATVNIQLDSWWVGGTYGPDAPVTINPLSPIKYVFRYRSTSTGAVSAPSPLCRNGLAPNRQQIIVTGPGSTDPQCDTVDIARSGGSIDGSPQFVSSVPNTTNWTFTDNFSDEEASGDFDLGAYPPWPIQGKPITGAATICGTTVTVTSAASTFLPATLLAGTLVVINGVTTEVYGAPSGATFQTVENVGTGTGVAFTCESPTTFGNPLPYICLLDGSDTLFACGDTVNPGRIYFTTRGTENAASANFVDVCGPTEPLQGCKSYNGYVAVPTSESWQVGRASTDPSNPFVFTKTSVGQGLLAPWAWDVGPLIFFISRNGIMATDLGPAQSLSDKDLYPFLPHDGQGGLSINGYPAPDITKTTQLRLCYAKQGWLYFDFQDLAGSTNSLAFNLLNPSWHYDHYNPAVALHYQQETPNSIAVLCACVDGTIQFLSSTQAADTGGPINCHVRLRADNFGDFRPQKQFGDFILDCDGSSAAVTATLLANNWFTQIATGQYNSFRVLTPVDVDEGFGALWTNAALDITWSGQATLFQYDIAAILKPEQTVLRATDWIDLGAMYWLQGLRITADTGGVTRTITVQYDGFPIPTQAGTFNLEMTHNGQIQIPYQFFQALPVGSIVVDNQVVTDAFTQQPQPVIARRIRLIGADVDPWTLFTVDPIGTKFSELGEKWISLQETDWIDLGQSMWLQGLEITADTLGVAHSCRVDFDGAPFPGAPGASFSLTLQHNGEVQLPYSFPPVIAHRVRIVPTDGAPTWPVFAVRPVGEISPELTTNWQTQPTTHDLKGYQHVRAIRLPIIGTPGSALTLQTPAEFPGNLSIPVAPTGAYQKLYIPLPPNKSMWYQWNLTGGAVRVFMRDLEVECKPWGSTGPYARPSSPSAM
jgi:hypothetical protein